MFDQCVLEILSIALIRRIDRKPKSTSTTQTTHYIKQNIDLQVQFKMFGDSLETKDKMVKQSREMGKLR